MSGYTYYTQQGTSIRWRCNNEGWERSDGKQDGNRWYFSYPPSSPVYKDIVLIPDNEPEPVKDEELAEREVFGETLDEPIPDDLWEMISSL